MEKSNRPSVKKIPVQISQENVDYLNRNNLSIAKTVNSLLDKLRIDDSNTSKENKCQKISQEK